MIKEFYRNPQTFSPEIEEAFKFPDHNKLKEWKIQHEQPREGPIDVFKNRPKMTLQILGIGIGLYLIHKAMGPHGDAMKIIRNKNMSPLRYYGLRITPLLIGGLVFHSMRKEVDYSNPYSRGQLK